MITIGIKSEFGGKSDTNRLAITPPYKKQPNKQKMIKNKDIPSNVQLKLPNEEDSYDLCIILKFDKLKHLRKLTGQKVMLHLNR